MEDACDVRLSLTANVVAAYADIRVYQQRIRNATQQIAAQEETLRIAQAKYESGATSKLDMSQATATLELIRASTPELSSALREANNRLCLLLGLPPRDLLQSIPELPIPVTPESVVVGVPRDLIRRRPDIRRAERAVAAQCALIGVAKADLYPTFTLKGTVNWQSFVFPELFTTASNAGAIIPGLRWDILNYGRILNRIRAQETRYEESIVNYRQVVLNVNTEVENTLNGFLRKKEQIAFVKKAVDATRESLATGQKQYAAGSVEFDRVNSLRKELVSQLDMLAIEEGKAVLLLIQLYKTMGGGWTVQGHETMQQPNFAAAELQQTGYQTNISGAVKATEPQRKLQLTPTNFAAQQFRRQAVHQANARRAVRTAEAQRSFQPSQTKFAATALRRQTVHQMNARRAVRTADSQRNFQPAPPKFAATKSRQRTVQQMNVGEAGEAARTTEPPQKLQPAPPKFAATKPRQQTVQHINAGEAVKATEPQQKLKPSPPKLAATESQQPAVEQMNVDQAVKVTEPQQKLQLTPVRRTQLPAPKKTRKVVPYSFQ